jgi:photosystem II stability/assembly factor-like uncharacterized protein
MNLGKLIISSAILLFSWGNLISQTDCGIHPENYSYSITDAAFIADSTIVMICSGGQILKSKDLGANWYRINSGTEYNLRKIQFIDDSTGYILDTYSNLLRTDDAGEDWFSVPSQNAVNLFFLSADTGFLVGDGGIIKKTNDGGKSWINQIKSSNDLKAVYFVNDSVGFIGGSSSTLFKTTDFGTSWVEIDMDPFSWSMKIIDMVFTSEAVGYLMGDEGEIIKTTDQGNSWSLIYDISTDWASSIYFTDENTGYVVGGWSNPTFVKTTDAGLTWQEIEIDYFVSFSGIAFNENGKNGIVVGSGTSNGSTSEPGNIVKISENWGENWDDKSYLDGENDFYDIVFFEDSVGYLFGGYYYWLGNGYKTYNKGLTWEKLNISAEDNIVDCYFINKDIGFIDVANDSIYRTLDGGNTWMVLPGVASSNFKSNHIYFFSQDTGFYTTGAYILKTETFGNEWDTVAGPGYWINDIDFINDSVGIAVGYRAASMTTDRGNTWNSIETLANEYLQTVFFMSRDDIYIAGQDGLIFISEDGGIGWTKLETSITSDIVDLYFNSNSEGIAITNSGGGLGYVYLSNDAGLSWSLFSTVFENIYKYADVNLGKGFIIGERGTLIKLEPNYPPLFPSYIIGDTLVFRDSTNTYLLWGSSEDSLNWSAESAEEFTDFGDSIHVSWSDTGYYSISLYLENICGISQARELMIHVIDSIPNNDTLNIFDFNKIENKLLLYPNPLDDLLYVKLQEKSLEFIIKIYDLRGSLIWCGEAEAGIARIELQDFKPGLYLIEVRNYQEVYSGIFIKR